MENKSKKGRKPLKDRDDLKIQVPIYIRKNHIKAIGGLEKTKELLLSYIDNIVQ
jgi:hypothetical protein